jgi:hypothetical protein
MIRLLRRPPKQRFGRVVFALCIQVVNDALTASHAAIEQRLEAIEALLASSQKK